MPLTAFALVLAAAVLHASWNLLVKASGDRLVAAWIQLSFGAVCSAPVLVALGLPTDRVWSVVASSVVHVIYALALVRAYEHGDLSVVYPVARGSAPALVTLGAALVLDDVPGATGVVAIALIVVGVLAVARGEFGRGVAWALATGVCIAAYSLIDGAAVRQADESLRYTVAVFAGTTLLLTVVVLVLRGPRRMLGSVRVDWPRGLGGGVASAIAYILVLAAARVAPLGLVSAVRETAVVFGALGGWLVLGEAFGRRRVAAALVIAVGLGLVAI